MSSIERNQQETINELRRFATQTRRRNSLSERAKSNTISQQETYLTNSLNQLLR